MINSVAPLSALDLFNEKAERLIQRGRAKVAALKAKNNGLLPLACEKKETDTKQVDKSKAELKTKKVKGVKPQSISKRRLQAYGIDLKLKPRKRSKTEKENHADSKSH